MDRKWRIIAAAQVSDHQGLTSKKPSVALIELDPEVGV